MTFGNVLEWSCDNVGVNVEPGLDDNDDGEQHFPYYYGGINIS